MTAKEAIEIIKTAIAEVEWEYPMDYAVAFDMAIEALEGKDTNVRNMISRQDTITAIRDYMVNPKEAISEYPDDVLKYNSGLLSAVQAVKDMPSAQPEQKKGYIEIRVISMFDGEDCFCSECGANSLLPSDKFCRKCGVEFIGVRGE